MAAVDMQARVASLEQELIHARRELSEARAASEQVAVAEQRQARASAARPPMEPSGDETIVLSAGGAA